MRKEYDKTKRAKHVVDCFQTGAYKVPSHVALGDLIQRDATQVTKKIEALVLPFSPTDA